MKNKLFKNIFKLIPAFLAIISALFLFSFKPAQAAEATNTLPDYFSVYLAGYATNTNSTTTETIATLTKSNNPSFTNGDAFFVNNTQAVVLEFNSNSLKDGNDYKINNLQYQIYYNNQSISANLTKNDGFIELVEETNGIIKDKDNITTVETENITAESGFHIYTLIINPSLCSNDFKYYGKYSITFSYQYLNDSYSFENKTFTCNFYVFNYSDYFINSKTFSGTDSSGSGIYYYNYTSNDMFNLVYDSSKFNVNITRIYQQLSTTTKITYSNNNEVLVKNYNEVGNETNQEYVYVDYIYDGIDANNNPILTSKKRITFNNLGTYYITYETIFNNGAVFNQYNLSTNNKSELLSNTINIYGVQAYFTSEKGLTEFKQAQKGNHSKIEQQADITGKEIYDSNGTMSFSEIKKLTPVKTNQAPVYFMTHATFNYSDSKYWRFADLSNLATTSTLSTNPPSYTNSPLSQSGVYLVQLAYTYSKISSSTVFYQYFLFEITTTSPNLTIQEIKYNQEGEPENVDIPTNHVTCNNVQIKTQQDGVFDSQATVKVYKATTFNTNDFTENNATILEAETTTFEENAKYKVEVLYGRSGQKKYISYFTIDKTGINGITINSATKISNTLYKKKDTNLLTNTNSDSPLFVNGAIAISWNAKEDNGYAQTYAEYKYFPTTYSASFANYLTSSKIQAFYNTPNTQYGIPSTDIFSFQSGELPVSTYSNTIGNSNLNETAILSSGGLYIIKIYDETALISENENNAQYQVVFIDNTKTNIISVEKNTWSFVKDAKTTSEDYTLYFGSNKLIKFLENSELQNTDSWLKAYFIKTDADYLTTFQSDYYLKIGIQYPIAYEIDSQMSDLGYVLTSEQNYGIKLSATIGNNPNESQYIFYVGCKSNLQYSSTPKKSYNASHMVTFSTDNSKMTLSYLAENGQTKNLVQATVPRLSENKTTKTNYYQPTAKNTLSDEIIMFSYCTDPSANLSVKSITMEYYAFEKGENNTYVFNTSPTSTLNIYDKTGIQLGSAISGESCTYEWELNVETNQDKRKTRAGKYVITREYVESSDKNDPLIRELVFIVDRNGIISSPETNEEGKLIYYTGGQIKLQVANDSDLYFYDIYYATQMSQNTQEFIPVLTTNLLPVTVYVPTYKYGYEKYDEKTKTTIFQPETSIVNYAKDEPFSNYELTATVEYYTNNTKTSSVISTTKLNAQINGYLSSNGKNLPTFTEEGYYKVTIESKAGDSFEYVFEIKYLKPEYSLLDTNNSELKSDNVFFYTNKDTIRISWQDSASKYLAQIDPNNISYTINGVKRTIDPSEIINNDTSHYVDLNLKDINAYVHNTQIEITLQYKGEGNNSKSEYFSKTSIVKVDTQAPLTNITNLIKQTGLEFEDLRDSSNSKFNQSKSTGLFANYSYVVDVANFTQLLKTPDESAYDYYKIYYRVFEKNNKNTKYEIGNVQESDITLNDFSSTTSNTLDFSDDKYNFNKFITTKDNEFVGKYVEFVEEDYAGNRTVYTIYITNAQDSTKFLTYKKSNQTSNNETIAYEQLKTSTSLDIYSKYSLNLEEINLFNQEIDVDFFIDEDNFYLVISINNVIYVKTPYSGKKFYKKSEYVDASSTLYSLEEISKLGSSSFIQSIVLYSVPVYQTVTINAHVINQRLEYYTLSNYYNDETREGIVIKLPNEFAADTNQLYCQTLEISGSLNIKIDNENYNNCFKTETTMPQTSTYTISYITSLSGTKYFVFEVTKSKDNNYYVYTITDNYGDKIVVPHIYNQKEIDKPITSETEYITSYDSYGNYVYYSSSNITYKFNSLIYPETTISILVGTQKYEYTLTINSSGNSEITKPESSDSNYPDYTNYFNVTNSSYYSICAITMKAATIDFSTGDLGNKYSFTVTQKLNEAFTGSDIQNEIETNFVTFNKLPNITLLGDNEDVTSILGNNQIYTKQIIVSYTKNVLDYPYMLYIISPENNVYELTDSFLATENGTYQIIVSYLEDLYGIKMVLEFTINNSDTFFYQIMKVNADGVNNLQIEATGSPFTYSVTEEGSSKETSVQVHYILNGDYVIELNKSKNLVYEQKGVVNTYTTIYLIHTDYQKPSASNDYYSKLIAITKIPKTNSLFTDKGFVKYESDGSFSDLTKKTSDTISVFTEEGFNKGRKISWSNYYLIPENKIKATIYYGEVGKSQFQQQVIESDNMSYITLKTSGVYLFKFEDLAGNVHYFGNYLDNEYFSMQYLSSVIFNINGDSPINHAIYDKEVSVVIPQTTLSIYDQNAYPVINVEINGVKTNVTTTTSYSWTFTKAGLYKIWFTAKIDGENIYEAPTYFTILSSEESRKSYSFNSYNNSYIEDIILNGKSIIEKLANNNVGTLYLDKYLKDFTIHVNDVKTGEGIYTIVVNANNDFNQKYSFTLWLNNQEVPLIISHESGTTTNENITISFSASNVLNKVGDCILKITNKDDIYITKEALENGKINELNEIVLSKTTEYYIEVTTLSGQLLFSSCINKVEPLNTVSIILIVVAVVVVVVGIVIFVLLRRKMKIK